MRLNHKGGSNLKGARKYEAGKKERTVSFKPKKPDIGKFFNKMAGTHWWKNLKLGQKYGVALFVTIGLFTVSTVLTFFCLQSPAQNWRL